MSERAVHVLLIEDDEGLRTILVRHLASRGFRVAEAASAEAASEQIGCGLRPALVLQARTLPPKTWPASLLARRSAREGDVAVAAKRSVHVKDGRVAA